MARRYIFKPPKSTRTIKHNNPKPLKVDLESAGCKLATHVYCGGFSSYVISGEGKVFAWGENTHGQLGLMNDEEEKAWIKKEEAEKRVAKGRVGRLRKRNLMMRMKNLTRLLEAKRTELPKWKKKSLTRKETK